MFIHEAINEKNKLFLLLMACLYCTSKLSVQENLMVENKILKTDVFVPKFLLRIPKDMHVIWFSGREQ